MGGQVLSGLSGYGDGFSDRLSGYKGMGFQFICWEFGVNFKVGHHLGALSLNTRKPGRVCHRGMLLTQDLELLAVFVFCSFVLLLCHVLRFWDGTQGIVHIRHLPLLSILSHSCYIRRTFSQQFLFLCSEFASSMFKTNIEMTQIGQSQPDESNRAEKMLQATLAEHPWVPGRCHTETLPCLNPTNHCVVRGGAVSGTLLI